jgi:hypothetical protein
MNAKQTWIVVGAIGAVIASAIGYIVLTKPPAAKAPNQATPTSQQPSNPAPTPEQAKGAYLDYSQQALTAAQGRKVLFFHASWCPQCRDIEASIKSLGVPDGMTIFKVNYDTTTNLKQRYGVTLQTTIVEVDDQGNQITKHVAYDEPSLPAVLKALNP